MIVVCVSFKHIVLQMQNANKLQQVCVLFFFAAAFRCVRTKVMMRVFGAWTLPGSAAEIREPNWCGASLLLPGRSSCVTRTTLMFYSVSLFMLKGAPFQCLNCTSICCREAHRILTTVYIVHVDSSRRTISFYLPAVKLTLCPSHELHLYCRLVSLLPLTETGKRRVRGYCEEIKKNCMVMYGKGK